jgi:hypothetical protein
MKFAKTHFELPRWQRIVCTTSAGSLLKCFSTENVKIIFSGKMLLNTIEAKQNRHAKNFGAGFKNKNFVFGNSLFTQL